MPDGHDRLLVPAVPRDPVISGLQGRAVLAHGPQPGLNQRARADTDCLCGFCRSGAFPHFRSGQDTWRPSYTGGPP